MCLVAVLYERILNPDSEEEVRVGVCVCFLARMCASMAAVIPVILHSLHAVHSLILTALCLQPQS